MMNNGSDSLDEHRSYKKGLVFLAAALVLLVWLLNTPTGLLGKADAVGYAVCHRIDARSFHIFERPTPLCARCSGMYLGALLGLVFQAFTGWRRAAWPNWKITVVLALMLGSFAVDGVNSFLHLLPLGISTYEPQNWLRLLTGTGMGFGLAAAIFPAFNQTAWIDIDDRPAIHNWRSLGILVVLGGVVNLLVLSENPVILYPLALASAASVVLLLTMVYTVIWLTIFKKENRYSRLRQMAAPLAAGFATALLQIFIINQFRFYLTGTWDGFYFG